MMKCFICCYTNIDDSKWPKIDILFILFWKRDRLPQFFWHLNISFSLCTKYTDFKKFLNIQFLFFCKKTIIYRILLKSAYSLLKDEERFNVNKIRGQQTRLRNKLDLMYIFGHFDTTLLS